MSTEIKEVSKLAWRLLDDIFRKIQDVHAVVRITIDREAGDAPGMSSAHFGAIQESEAMCAWAFALAGEKRREFIDNSKAEGVRGARL